jgi:hypothetical protein
MQGFFIRINFQKLPICTMYVFQYFDNQRVVFFIFNLFINDSVF